MREQIEQLRMEGKLGEMIDEVMQRMQEEGFISVDQPPQTDPATSLFRRRTNGRSSGANAI